MIPVGPSWPLLISEAHRSGPPSPGNFRAVGPAFVHSVQHAGAAQSRGICCIWANRVAPRNCAAFCKGICTCEPGDEQNLITFLCGCCRPVKLYRAQTTEKNPLYVLWTAGPIFYLFLVRSKPCHFLNQFTRRGDIGPGAAPGCWVSMGVAHADGLGAGWARYISRQGPGGGVSCLG